MQMIRTGFAVFSVPGEVWYCHRESNIFESLSFRLLWWMNALAGWYCCSQRFWVAWLHICMSACLLLRARGAYGVHPRWVCERVKRKRPAGADVQVKQVELAPAAHQLSVLIKMEIVNICGELIRPSDLSAPFIWVPSLKETRFSSDKCFFPDVLFIVHMLQMAPLIKKSSSEGMWLCLSGSFSCLKLERYAAYLSGEIHPSAEATVQMKNNPTCLFFSYSLQSKLEIRWKLLRGSTTERFLRYWA